MINDELTATHPVRLAGVVDDSVVDGPGVRLALFFQGCLPKYPGGGHCPGCHNEHTWAMDGGQVHTVGQLLARAAANPLLDGLTLTGGDPMDQPEAARLLAMGAHAQGLTVWAYTGYTWEQLRRDPVRAPALNEVDVLVDGPFERDLRSLALRFRGSTNQRVLDVRTSNDAGHPVWAASFLPGV